MASSRTLRVVVTGDAAGLQRTFTNAGSSAKKTGGLFNELGHHTKALVAGFVGFAAVEKASEFLKDATKAAMDDQAQLAILANQSNKAGVSWKTHGEEIESALTKMSAASGFMKSDLINSMGRLVTATGSAAKSTKLLGDAENISRARHVDLQTATQILIRANMGNIGALKRLGITIPGVTKGMTDQQKAALALATLHKRYAGASDAYANTSAGALAKLAAQWEMLKVKVGDLVLPLMARFAGFLATLIPILEQNGQLIKDIAVALGIVVAGWLAYEVATKVAAAAQALLNLTMDANPIGLVILAVTALTVAMVELYRHNETARRIIDAAFKAIKAAAEAALGWITHTGIPAVKAAWQSAQPVVRTLEAIVRTSFNAIKGFVQTVVTIVGDLMHGRWGAAFNAAKSAVGSLLSKVSDVVGKIPGVLRSALGAVGSAALSIGKRILSSIGSGIGDLGGWLRGKVVAAVNAVIDRVNSLLSFNVRVDTHIPGVGTVGFGNSMHIPHLAKGGIVSGPMLAVVGDNPGRREAIVPLNRAGGIAGLGGMHFTFNQVPADADPQAIAAATAWRVRTLASA